MKKLFLFCCIIFFNCSTVENINKEKRDENYSTDEYMDDLQIQTDNHLENYQL